MTYVYAAMWFVVGLLLILRMGKENRIFYAAGGFFIVLGGWWLASALGVQGMFSGTPGWILRGITAAALGFLCWAFLKESKKNDENSAKGEEPK